MTRRNVELKAHFPDLQAGHNAAARLGAIDTDTLQQVDTYFHSADGYAQLERLQHEFGIDGEAVIGASYSDLLQQAD